MIPNVCRNNYLAALSGFSNRAGHGEQLIAVLEFAQRWSEAVDWSTYEGAQEILIRCDAFDDPNRAENLNRRLVMPAASDPSPRPRQDP